MFDSTLMGDHNKQASMPLMIHAPDLIAVVKIFLLYVSSFVIPLHSRRYSGTVNFLQVTKCSPVAYFLSLNKSFVEVEAHRYIYYFTYLQFTVHIVVTCSNSEYVR